MHDTPTHDKDSTILQLSALAEIAGDIVACLSADGRVQWISRRGLDLLGLTGQDVTGQDFLELVVPPEDRKQAQCLFHACLGIGPLHSGTSAVHDIMTPSGRQSLRWTTTPLPGPDGHPASVLGIGQSTGEHAPLEADTLECRAIINAITDGLCILDAASGAIVDANDKMAAMFGHSLAELSSLAYADLSAGYPPYSQIEAEARVALARSGEAQDFEWLARHRGGQLFWIEVHLEKVRFKTQDSLICVIRDISRRKTSERAIRESEKKFRRYRPRLRLGTDPGSVALVPRVPGSGPPRSSSQGRLAQGSTVRGLWDRHPQAPYHQLSPSSFPNTPPALRSL